MEAEKVKAVGKVLNPKQWFLVLLTVLFVGLSIKYAMKVMEGRSAIQRWQNQILGLEQGEDLSEKYQYPNPPIMAILLFPLAKLPGLWMALIWYYLKVAMIILCFQWIFALVEKDGLPFPFWAKVLTVILSLRPINGDLQHGNVNIFIFFLVVAGVYLCAKKRDILGGISIGLAISCKVTPALFIPYFFWKRSWKSLAGVMLGLILFLWPGIIPGMILGFDENQKQLYSWYKEMVHPFLVEGKVWSEHNNQSFPGLVYRLFTHSPSFSDYVDGKYTPLEYHNFADLPVPVIRWFLKGALACFAILFFFYCRADFQKRGGWQLSTEFALVVLGMLFFSERTWKHHCVTMVFPFAVLSYLFAINSNNAGRRLVAILAIVLSSVLMWMTSTGLLKDEFAKEAQVYGCYTWAFVVLMWALIWFLSREPKPDWRSHPVS